MWTPLCIFVICTVIQGSRSDSGCQCNCTLTSLTGVITSPNYPTQKYDNDTFCTWTFPDVNASITFEVIHFELEEYSLADGCYDWLEIHDGSTRHRYCGSNPSSFITEAISKDVRFQFYSDSSLRFSGFRITYQVDISDYTECYQPLGMENEAIRDSQLTASSYYDIYHLPWKGRLNNINYWASESVDSPSWIQVDLLRYTKITGIVTQGSAYTAYYEWVACLQISYGDSTESLSYITENSEPKSFSASKDDNTPVEIVFPQPITARLLRIIPTSCNVWCSLRFEVLGCALGSPEIPIITTASIQCNSDIEFKCHDGSCILSDQVCNGVDDCPLEEDEQHCNFPIGCRSSLGLESRQIRDHQITSSSHYINNDNEAWQGRLNSIHYWATSNQPPAESHPWIQIDFLHWTQISGVITQGWSDNNSEWVDNIQIQYGDKTQLTFITENGEPKTFLANIDSETAKPIVFPEPIAARLLRVVPTSWIGWCSLRLEVIGCQLASTEKPPMPTSSLPISTLLYKSTTEHFDTNLLIKPTNAASSSAPMSAASVVIVIVIVVVLLIIIIILVVIVFKNKKRNTTSQDQQELTAYVTRIDDIPETVTNVYESVTGNVLPVFEKHEIHRSKLEVGEELGKGAFGVVYKATLINENGTKNQVAAKGLKAHASADAKTTFLQEIQLIIEIGSHPNILGILACITKNEPFYLVTEFMKYGDLLEFLRKCRKDEFRKKDEIYTMSESKQLHIAQQIAYGMDYLSSTRYYHGDLAARNILVGEELAVKVSDFGMADDVYARGYTRMSPDKRRPIKWVSLETNLQGQCSIMSDVWSYGIVLYEIVTLGDMPYPGMDGPTIVQKLKDGYRMEKPEKCSNDMYTIMKTCWLEDPESRPQFNDLVEAIAAIQSDVEYDVVDQTSPRSDYPEPDESVIQNITSEGTVENQIYDGANSDIDVLISVGHGAADSGLRDDQQLEDAEALKSDSQGAADQGITDGSELQDGETYERPNLNAYPEADYDTSIGLV